MNFNNEYLIKFDNKYTKENFNCDKPLFFFLGVPKKQEINMKYVCASCFLVKDDIGIYIKDFKINTNTKGKRLKSLLDIQFKNVSIYRNIIKKSEIYHLSSTFINIKIYDSEESRIISKKEKFDDITIF